MRLLISLSSDWVASVVSLSFHVVYVACLRVSRRVSSGANHRYTNSRNVRRYASEQIWYWSKYIPGASFVEVWYCLSYIIKIKNSYI